MIKTLQKLYALLTPAERWQCGWLFLAMVVMATLDVVGIASVMPFMAIVANPDAMAHSQKLNAVYHYLNFSSSYHFIIFLGLIVFALCVLGNFYTMMTNWLIYKFANRQEYLLSRRLLAKYLYQSYVFFLNRNTVELGKNILYEVTIVITNILIPAMEAIAKILVTTFILSLLFFMDPRLAIGIFAIMGCLFSSVFYLVRKKLHRISHQLNTANERRHKMAAESLSGIKDIKLLNKENIFLNEYALAARQHAKARAFIDVFAFTPRYALEAIASGGILLIVLYLLITKQNISNAIPYVALYAYASYRLMPALQQIFNGITRIRTHQSAVDILAKDLITFENSKDITIENSLSDSNIPNLPFKNQIELSNITFQYPQATKPALQNLQLTIPVNSFIGFVGMTGSGKTTTVDLILGLFQAQQGSLAVDGVIITEDNRRQWQKNLGYVPQSIYLTDDTIAANIAFGVPHHQIDMDAVVKAARIANIDDFITQELPQQYHTLIGERGIRLSGGQRQRIGIARALYRDPAVLVFDEATSALDNLTENYIMAAIQKLSHKKTIILVAHRLTTVMKCDQIVLFEKGMIVGQGLYQELIQSNNRFKALANIDA